MCSYLITATADTLEIATSAYIIRNDMLSLSLSLDRTLVQHHSLETQSSPIHNTANDTHATSSVSKTYVRVCVRFSILALLHTPPSVKPCRHGCEADPPAR